MGLFDRPPPTTGLSRLDNTCNNSERSSRRITSTNFHKTRPTNEAPFQMLGERTFSTTLGLKELYSTQFWLSLLSECLSCFLYVFIVCSTRISWTGAIIGHEPNLIAMSLTSGIAMMLLIFIFKTVHVNPALTISFLLTGRIPIVRAASYILVHCTGAVAAIAFLYFISIKGHAGALGLDNPHEILTTWQILIVEIVISFVVTLATYATCNLSSYTSAKKLILEQLGQDENLFPTSITCDSATGHRNSRRSVVAPTPIVPQQSTTSISLLNDTQRRIDLMTMATSNNIGVINYNNDHVTNNKPPYLVSNHYNQVYDDTHLITVPGQTGNNKRNLLMDSSQNYDTNEARFLSQVVDNNYSNCTSSNNPASNSSGGSNNISLGLTTALVRNTDYNAQNGGVTLPNFRTNLHNKGFSMSSFQEHDNNNINDNYDYEYDNHRIYATQQLKSESSSQVPIEEIMQDECQLLAPNGFSLHVTSRQAFVIGLAYTLMSLSGVSVLYSPRGGLIARRSVSLSGPKFLGERWRISKKGNPRI